MEVEYLIWKFSALTTLQSAIPAVTKLMAVQLYVGL